MESTRVPMLVWGALFAGATSACDAPVRGSAQDSDVAGGSPRREAVDEATWTPRPDGPTLHEFVVSLARDRASSPWSPPDSDAAASLASLTYGQQRAIRFRADAAVWRGASPFELQFFHPGGAFRTPVRMHLVEGEHSRVFPYDPTLFDLGNELDGVDLTLPPSAGYPGFRALYAMNEAHRVDEVVAFLGASYFRLVGPQQVYGLSSRGLAVNTAGPEGEEFPDFTEFWLVRPEPGATTLTFFGLLDGPSVAGAYRFDLTPGGPPDAGGPGGDTVRGTELVVDARIFARRSVTKLGVAPLTSMYLHGTFRPGGADDVRPRVHDSEGLLMATSGGEWIWRPLTNRASLQVTALRDRGPRGFGLVQRERDFDRYLDLEAQYHRRPSQWVEIVDGDWGAGGVELVEIPTATEFSDNIVAYWAPDGGLRAGEERRYRYRLRTFDSDLAGQDVARVVRTRIGWDALPGQADPPPRTRRRMIVDFAGPGLAGVPEESVEPVLQASTGRVVDLRVQRLPGGGLRATFALEAEADRPSDLRLFLRGDGAVLTETWSYLWRPADGR